MADFSGSGIEGLPPTTLESLQKGGDPRVLGWLREVIVEGDRLNRSDPAYDQMELGMRYISGDQRVSTGNTAEPPGYLGRTIINESRKVVQAHVSALTDLKPLFSYKSPNPAFATHCAVLNQLLVAWWITQMADVALGDVVKYSLAAGTGDCVLEWNPNLGLTGDVQMSARDPRDTLPWRPATHDRSIQAWEGVVLRESHTVNVMKAMYPEYAPLFRPTTDSLLSTLMGRFRQVVARVMSPADDTLSGLNAPAMASRVRSGEILLYRTYLTDRSKNLTSKPIPMGKPGTSWAYLVPPGGYLYPFKRLILATPELMLYDGPNPAWHGQFPVSRLMLWSMPWHFLGRALLHDLLPLQDAINQSEQDIQLGIRKWMDPTVIYNRNAVSESFMRIFDARRTGAKVKLNAEGMKDGFRLQDGPAPAVIQLAIEHLGMMIDKFHDLSGTPNLQQLLELRQLPGADTLQAYWQALTPELRQEGRAIEAFLRSIATQWKALKFQYESQSRRVAVAGDAGQLLEDFDFDPEQMVPAQSPVVEGAPGQPASPNPYYQKEFDSSLPRDQRAMNFQRTVVFTIAPNSILGMNAMEGKLVRLQLAREGFYDAQSLAETLEIDNYGTFPPIPLPPLRPVTPVEVQQSILAGEGKYTLDPMSGQILEIRAPITVLERLQAQAMLGLGQVAGPAGRSAQQGQQSDSGSGGQPGRKASGQAPPRIEQKGDGRTTVTESRHNPGPGSR